MLTPFSELLARFGRSQDKSVEIPTDWMQGRSTYGGLQAAIALAAMRALEPQAPLRTLQVTFVAPLAGVVKTKSRLLRRGRSATQVLTELIDEADTCGAVVVGIFGKVRSSVVRAELGDAPAIGEREAIPFPFIPGVTPAFLQHYQSRMLAGEVPYAARPARTGTYETTLVDAGAVSELHLVNNADFAPPLALSHLRVPAPGSTLTWMLELLTHDFEGISLENWRIDARLHAGAEGYTQQSTVIRDGTGRALAIGQQTMAVFG